MKTILTFTVSENIHQAQAQAYQNLIDQGHDPKTAAEIIDLGFMSFEEWQEHYQHYRDNRCSDYHEQMVRY